MEFAVAILSKLLFASGFIGPNWTTNYGGDATLRANCLALMSSLSIENTTILDASYLPAPSTIRTSGTCRSTATHTAPICRVRFHTNTSATSGIDAEAWLPDEWYGRFMGIGNQGMQGCILYDDLDHGSALHFATVGSNNGHDGDTALPFFHNPDVLYDFSARAIHVEAVVGKQIVEAYYGRPPAYSYYNGCSTGGRQGTQAALKHPDDFDGILAGAPAIDFNHLVHWTGMVSRHLGAPAAASPSFIPLASWKIIAEEVLRQCDALDGVVDRVITDPDSCVFRPESLLCSGEGSSRRSCFTTPQVEALRKIYSPLYGLAGELLYSRFDPGAESSPFIYFLLNGEFHPYAEQWLKYVVLNVTDYDISDYGAKHGALSDSVNGGDIATFDGDFSAFRDRGGKFLSYHGRADPVIPSGNSKRLYDLISRTLSMPTLDTFYRLFLVPGLDHCRGGAGAFKFGQAPGTHVVNSSSHDIILALVDWVEKNVAPDTIIGTASDGATRVHCRYPIQSRWNGSAYRCEAS